MKEPWKGNKLFHRVQYAAVSPQPIHPLSPSIPLPPPLAFAQKPLISPQY